MEKADLKKVFERRREMFLELVFIKYKIENLFCDEESKTALLGTCNDLFKTMSITIPDEELDLNWVTSLRKFFNINKEIFDLLETQKAFVIVAKFNELLEKLKECFVIATLQALMEDHFLEELSKFEDKEVIFLVQKIKNAKAMAKNPRRVDKTKYDNVMKELLDCDIPCMLKKKLPYLVIIFNKIRIIRLIDVFLLNLEIKNN